MCMNDALPLPEAVLDDATIGKLGLLKAAERLLRSLDTDAVRLHLPGGRSVVLLAAPHHAAYWQDHPEAFEKASLRPDTGAGLTREVLGLTLLTAPEGSDWKALRDQMTTLLSHAKPWFERPLASATDKLVAALSGCESALLEHCIAWSVRVICEPVLGTSALDHAARDIVIALNDGFIARLEGQTQPEGLQARYSAFLLRVARESGPDSIAAQVSPPTEAMLRAVVGGILAGSLHINALALYWLLVQVAAEPDLQERLAAEAQATAAARALNAPLAFATVRESQRLRPTMAFIERQVRHACRIGNTVLRPGETVLFSPWFAQRAPAAWSDPLRFDPGRFLPGRKTEPGANLPFGLGPRQCPGAKLVNRQLTFALSSLCHVGRLSLAPATRPGDLAGVFRVNLEPRGSLRLVLAPWSQCGRTAPATREKSHAC